VSRAGRALSNSPPVTLAIESGPGEFPTGPTITFDPDSDIAIRDGMAAMEFRSYHSGKTIIRATSPGLKDATLTITSLGGPKFIAGKTPPVKPRPYVRFTGPRISNSVFGLNNPVLASSEMPDHAARLGNDGGVPTFWQPQAGDTNAWWQVDLERSVTMEQVKTTFPTEGNYRYKIETSNDGLTWTLAADQTQTTGNDRIRMDALPKETTGHLLRVTFTGLPAAIAEVEITGHLAAQ
jgi:hypothetical protein